MSNLKEDLEAIARRLQEVIDSIPDDTPGPVPDPDPIYKPLPDSWWRSGESSDKPGKYYFLVKPSNSRLEIGGKQYEFNRTYHTGEELWYGTSRGKILLTRKDGTVYKGSTGGAVDPPSNDYHTYPFHHTTTASSDGGKSLVLCPGDPTEFDRVWVEGTNVTIPRHANDHGRVTYWNMRQEPDGDILAKKGNKIYKFPASRAGNGVVRGTCG